LTTQLTVQVNDEFKLDAGRFAFVGEGNDRQRVLTPPAVTMFEQLISYLDAKPLPANSRSFPTAGQEGVAAAALCLRWGSYFAVLADQTKPLWRQARSKELREDVSRISDSEMARINIEASAAMAAWVDIFRSDPFGRYSELVAKALTWLPMPQRKVAVDKSSLFYGLALPEFRQQLTAILQPDQKTAGMAELEAHASRVFGNALVNHGWRNGPVEDVHAGRCPPDLPLDQCRIPAAELRELMRYSAARFQAGMAACLSMYAETPEVAWPEQVLPFSQAQILLITPSGWTLTEESREVRDFVAGCSSTAEDAV
jgi:hypothetical protein